MEEQVYWFEVCKKEKRHVAIHWKGKALEIAPVVFSAIWVCSTIAHFIPAMQIDTATAFLTFSMFSFSQGIKYFFYHEKTRSDSA